MYSATRLATVLITVCLASPAVGIPSLQLGPGSGNWTYDTSTETWVTPDNPLNLLATANESGSGGYAWDPSGSADQMAYLVISADSSAMADVFDVTVWNDGITLSSVESGVGQPPASDPNSLAPHGIFDTWYEIYEFDFDGIATTISDTQPGSTGTGSGFVEYFDITINSISQGELHFDLFTMEGDGLLANNTNVNAFAPFSHDGGGTTTVIPEPSAFLVFSTGFVLVGMWTRRR